MLTDAQLAAQVATRLDALAAISEEPGRLTRTFGSPAMRQANDTVAGWMREAGMTVRQDTVGNLIGTYPARESGRPLSPSLSPATGGGEGAPRAGEGECDVRTFVLGSHLDTVRDAGKFDGALGVLVAIGCVHKLHQTSHRLRFNVEVVAFADEEGVRFQTACLGSRAMTGTVRPEELRRRDAAGITLEEAILGFGGDPARLRDAIRDPKQLAGYAEVHIEQGPVLHQKELPVGVVSAISGQTRLRTQFLGCAAHAGTTPMTLRRDALVPAAEFILMVQSVTEDDPELVATVGQVEVRPGASNVIPGRATLSVDVRHPLDDRRESACEHLRVVALDLAKKGGVELHWELVQETDSVSCSPALSRALAEAACRHVGKVVQLPSGAGHDAAIMAAVTPVAMLFVRCRDGLSHHPDESVREDDIRVAITVLSDFLLSKRHES